MKLEEIRATIYSRLPSFDAEARAYHHAYTLRLEQMVRPHESTDNEIAETKRALIAAQEAFEAKAQALVARASAIRQLPKTAEQYSLHETTSSHDNPPEGYERCTRKAGHSGPCAHAPIPTVERALQKGL